MRRLFGWLFVLVSLAAMLCVWWFGSPHFWAWRATKALKRDSILAADRLFVRATAAGVHNGDFLLMHARCHRKLSRLEEMSRLLKEAVNAGADATLASIEARMADAQRGNLTALESDLSWLFQSYDAADEICDAFVQGCLLKYRLDDALQLIRVWEADYRDDARPHLYRGRIYEHQLRLDDAVLEFKEALRKNPSSGAAAYNVARVLQTQKNPEQALEYYLKCADVLGDPRPGWIAAAGCCRVLNEHKRGRQYLDQARSHSAGDISSAFRLVGEQVDAASTKIAAELGAYAFAEEDFETAVVELQLVVDAVPADWRSRYQLSQALQKCGRTKDARKHAEIVTATREALESCDVHISTLKRDPQNVDARFAIGSAFLKYVSENQGLTWLDSVLDIVPDHTSTHEVLADYFEKHTSENPRFELLAKKHRKYVNAGTTTP